jgi:hypothetical protein
MPSAGMAAMLYSRMQVRLLEEELGAPYSSAPPGR